MNRDIRVFPYTYSEIMRLDAREGRLRIGKALGVPIEIEPRLDVPGCATVECDDVRRDLPFAQSRRDGGGIFRRLVIRARHPQTQAPARNCRRATRDACVVFDDRCRGIGGEQKQIERLVLNEDRVASVRPVRMADAVRHHARRVNEDAPCTMTFARAPCERRVLVGEARVDTERILDLRMNQLSTLVERSELFAQPVHVLVAAQRERRRPQAALADAAERWQTRKTAKMLVRGRTEYRAVFPEQLKPQRRTFDFQDRVARDEPPRPRRSGCY